MIGDLKIKDKKLMPKCVLIVDDDRVAVEFARHTLQSKGYEIIVARNGLEALEMLKRKLPDLILLDVQMPQMDGYGFIKQKSNDPAVAKIPVIVLSGMGKTEPLFKRYGVKAYLIKPLNNQDLLNKVQEIVPLEGPQ